MKRYRGIFTKTAAPETRRSPASVGPELSSNEVNLRSRAPHDPVAVPDVHHLDDEEIILLESDSPAGQPRRATQRGTTTVSPSSNEPRRGLVMADERPIESFGPQTPVATGLWQNKAARPTRSSSTTRTGTAVSA